MTNLGGSAGWGAAIAASLLAGAAVAAVLRLPERVAATITARRRDPARRGGPGAGAGCRRESRRRAHLPRCAGRRVLFVGADAWLTRDDTMEAMRRSAHAAASGQGMMMTPDQAEGARGEAVAAGIFIDGVPESVALGLMIAQGSLGVALLAGVLVGNLVEAYGATQPIVAAGRSKRFATGLLGGIGLALGVSTVLGGTVLAGAAPALIGGAQAVAAGAVLAVISISIISHAYVEVSGGVALATVAGFVVGYLLS